MNPRQHDFEPPPPGDELMDIFIIRNGWYLQSVLKMSTEAIHSMVARYKQAEQFFDAEICIERNGQEYYDEGYMENQSDECLNAPSTRLIPTPRTDFCRKKKIPATLAMRVYRRDDFTCKLCGVSGVALCCDHIIPESHGGRTSLDNLQAACFPCNSAKGNKLPT